MTITDGAGGFTVILMKDVYTDRKTDKATCYTNELPSTGGVGKTKS